MYANFKVDLATKHTDLKESFNSGTQQQSFGTLISPDDGFLCEITE